MAKFSKSRVSGVAVSLATPTKDLAHAVEETEKLLLEGQPVAASGRSVPKKYEAR